MKQKLYKLFALLGVLLFLGAGNSYALSWSSSYYYNLTGSYNDWQDNGKQAPTSSTILEWNNIKLYSGSDKTGEFEFKVWIGGETSIYMGNEQGGPIEVNTWVQCYENGGHIKVKNDNANKSYTIRYNVGTNEVMVVDGTTPPPSTKFTFTVYYTNPEGWETVKAYVWKDKDTSNGWPGKDMTKGADGKWFYTATLDFEPTQILFDNGNSGNENQTNDLAFVNGKTYTDRAIQPSIGGTGVYLTFASDDYAKLDYNEFSYLNDNEYKLTVTLDASPAGQPYKIKIWYNNGYRGVPIAVQSNIGQPNKDILMDGGDFTSSGYDLDITLQDKSNVTFYYKKDYGANNEHGQWTHFTSLYYSVDPILEYTDRPAYLYLYGHVNGGYWNYKNYIPLKKGDDGKYYAEKAEITGLWKQKDRDLGAKLDPPQDRVVDTSSGNTNYVALYTQKATNDDFDDAGKGLNKFGSITSENNEDNYSNCRINDRPNNTATINYQRAADSHNFLVNGGVYNIIVDLENNTITFEPVEDSAETPAMEHTFNWWFGDDENDDNADATLITENTKNIDEVGKAYDNHAYHTFTYGDTQVNVIQPGIKTTPEHRLAQQAVFTIWYADPSYVPSGDTKNVRLMANDAEATGELDYSPADAIADGDLPNDFTLITDPEGEIKSEYSSYAKYLNDNKLGSNYLIQLNQAGYYVVSADIKDGADFEGYNYTVNPSSLFVNVQPLDIATEVGSGSTETIVNVGDNAPVPFSVESRDYLANGLISMTQAMVKGTDFDVTIAPATEGWVNDKDYPSYETALAVPGTQLFDQYSQVADGGAIVDAMYTTSSIDAEAVSEENTSYNVTATLPCSGVYTVTVTGKGNYTGSVSGSITVYPNIVAKFGVGEKADNGFNIQGYSFNYDKSDLTINIPVKVVEGFLTNPEDNYEQNVRAFIPGTYFVSTFADASKTNGLMTLSDNDYAPGAEHYVAMVDLSALATGQQSQQTLKINIAKNGASHTYTFLVQKSDSGIQASTTGVETIGAEDGEAEYFNLQGVKVQNPEHGIYVKVQNGKAEKVVL